MELKYPEIMLIQDKYRKSPSGRTLWCGPFAIATIAGISYDEAHAKAVAVEQRRLNAEAKRKGLRPGYWKCTHFKGMGASALQRTAERLGVRMTKWSRRHRGVTLLTFVREHTVSGNIYVVCAGHHWMTIRDGILYHSHHDPLPVEDAPRYKRAIVKEWMQATNVV